MKKTTLGPFQITPYVKEHISLKFQAPTLLGSLFFSYLFLTLRHPEGVDLGHLFVTQLMTYAILMPTFIAIRVLYDTVMGEKGN